MYKKNHRIKLALRTISTDTDSRNISSQNSSNNDETDEDIPSASYRKKPAYCREDPSKSIHNKISSILNQLKF